MENRRASETEIQRTLKEFLEKPEHIYENPKQYFTRLKWLSYYGCKEIIEPTLFFCTQKLFPLWLHDRITYCRIVTSFYEVFYTCFTAKGNKTVFCAWDYLEDGTDNGLPPVDAVFMTRELCSLYSVFDYYNELRRAYSSLCVAFMADMNRMSSRKVAGKYYKEGLSRIKGTELFVFEGMAYAATMFEGNYRKRMVIVKRYGADHLKSQTKREKDIIRRMNIATTVVIAIAFLLREDVGKVYDYLFSNWKGVLEVAFFVGLMCFMGFILNLGEPDYKNARSGPVFISHIDGGGGWGWGTFFG